MVLFFEPDRNCRGWPGEMGVDEVKPYILFPDEVPDCKIPEIGRHLLRIVNEWEGKTPGKKKTTGVIYLYIIVLVIGTIPVIGQQPETEQNRADNDDLFKKLFEWLDLVFYKDRTNIPFFFIRIVWSDHKKYFIVKIRFPVFYFPVFIHRIYSLNISWSI
jgi:hypothetical protein